MRLGLNHRKLKSIFINPAFQINFLLISLCLITTLSSIYFLAVRYTFGQFEAMGISTGLPPSNVYFQFIDDQRSALYLTMVVSYGVMVILAGIVSYWFSHKVAGPLHRLKVSLNAMAEKGELKEISFRKDDFFRDVPHKFNEMVRSQSNQRKQKKS